MHDLRDGIYINFCMYAQLLLRTYYFTSESYLLFVNEHVFTDHTLLIDQVCPSCKVGCMQCFAFI